MQRQSVYSVHMHRVYAVNMHPPARLLRSYVRTLQTLTWLIVAAYLGQAVLAGQFLSGSYPALGLHGTGGTVSDAIVIVAVIVAALLRWHGRGKAWPFWAALALLAANQVQNAAGAARLITLHIPLGTAMLGVAVAVALAAAQTGRLTASSPAPYSDEISGAADANVASSEAASE